jgi:hypothetical protein
MKSYKVYCEFYIQADDESKAEEIVIEDMAFNNFYEEHIIIEEAEKPEEHDFFNEVEKDDN